MVRRGFLFCASILFLLLASCASKQEEDNVVVPPANIIRPLPSKNKVTVKPQESKKSAKTELPPAQEEKKVEEVKEEIKEEVKEEIPLEEPVKEEAPMPEPVKEPEPEPVYEDPDVAPAALAFAVQTEREKAPLPISDPEPVPEVKTQPAKTETKVQPKTEVKTQPKTETKVQTKQETKAPAQTSVKQESQTPAKTEVKTETKKEEVKQDVKKNEEYERSVGKSTTPAVTIQVFEEDKKDILNIISKLDTVMKNRDYKTWLTYLNDESIRYWSNRSNLAKAENRLPVKGLQLRNLEDYFKYVFIPSRSGRRVDEIRYENDRQVKAVQVNGDTDVVYYNFEKDAKGVWKLRLPSNSD